MLTTVTAKRLNDRLAELIEIPSVTGDESDAADAVAGWLEVPGVEVDRWSERMVDLEGDPDYPGREVERDLVHVVAAEVRGARSGPSVVLTGHLDTVPPGDPSRWNRGPFSAEIDAGHLYGLGACDMKSGLVAAAEAFLTVAAGDREFAGTLRFVAVSGEEDGGTGTLAAIRRGWSGDFVVLTEPTSGPDGPAIVVAHGGALTFTITVTGRSAHGSMPAEGESALDHFWTVYRAMRDLEETLNEAEDDPLMAAIGTPYATSVGKVAGGTWASNVMEELTAEVRVGVALHETVAEAEERFAATLLAAISSDPWLRRYPPRIERTGAAFGSASIDPDHELVRVVADAAEQVIGRRPILVGKPYGCDMALWTRVGGAATVVYGPGDVRAAHAPNERVSLAEMKAVADVLADTAGRLLRVGSAPHEA